MKNNNPRPQSCSDNAAPQRMEESADLHRSILKTAIDGFFRLDMQGCLLEVTEAYCRMSGYSEQELLTMRIPDLEVVESADDTAAHRQKIITQGKDRFESRHRRKDGCMIDVEVSVQYLPNVGGCFVGFLRDITERKQAEAAIVRERNFSRKLLDTAQVIILVLDPQGRIVSFNLYMETISGYSLEDVKGKDWFTTFLPECDYDKIREIFKEAVHDVETRGNINPIITKDGKEIFIEWYAKTLKDEQGGIIGVLAVGQDITARKQAEEALIRAKEEAEVSNRAKSEFLAMMSHELRTPMNSIVGFTDLVLQSELTPEQKKCLGIVQSRSKDLLVLLLDILDLSKIEAERMVLAQDPFSIEQLVSGVLQMFCLDALNKTLSLDKTIAPNLPTIVYGDEQRLRQVLLNLVGNTVKFTEKGGMHVSVQWDPCTDPDSNDMVLHVQVKDTGIGIPTDKTDEIFKPFTQADNSHTRKYGGTGLGLAIVKRLVKMMCGRVWVESEQGAGSTFHFTACLALQPSPGMDRKQTLPVERSPSGKRLRVLVVEDDEASGMLIVKILKNRGHVMMQASTGQEALTAMSQADYDVVLMDVIMPGMDGLEATRRIRNPASPVRNHRIPIIALTGNAMTGDKEECLASGMNGYVAKPIDADTLLKTINQVMAG